MSLQECLCCARPALPQQHGHCDTVRQPLWRLLNLKPASHLCRRRRGGARCSLADGDELMLELQYGASRLRALEEYRQHVRRPPNQISLLDCAVLIAKHAYPQLDEGTVRYEIERLANAVLDAMPEDPYPLRVLQTISRQLYEVNGFRGAKQTYYDPDNSCINKVLENRAGIPITLALVYMEVAARVGFSMVGLNMPGHFMITPKDPSLQLMIDPFFDGEICFIEDAEQRLSSLYSQPVKIRSTILDDKEEAAIRPHAFLMRMLHNLKGAYLKQNDPEKCLRIQQYLRATMPDDPSQLREEALCLWALQRYSECGESLQAYLDAAPAAPDAHDVRGMLQLVRRAMSEGGTKDLPGG